MEIHAGLRFSREHVEMFVFFRHLQQSGTLDVMGDLTQDILDLADRDITDKVQKLIWKFCQTGSNGAFDVD